MKKEYIFVIKLRSFWKRRLRDFKNMYLRTGISTTPFSSNQHYCWMGFTVIPYHIDRKHSNFKTFRSKSQMQDNNCSINNIYHILDYLFWREKHKIENKDYRNIYYCAGYSILRGKQLWLTGIITARDW